MENRILIFKRNWQAIFALPVLFLLIYLYPKLPWVTKKTTCAVKIITGIDCPGCGITRSLSSLLHGNFQNSLYHHPLGILLFFGMSYLFFKSLTEVVLGVKFRPLLGNIAKTAIGCALLLALLVTWIVRIAF